jgi:hypothetical protein
LLIAVPNFKSLMRNIIKIFLGGLMFPFTFGIFSKKSNKIAIRKEEMEIDILPV